MENEDFEKLTDKEIQRVREMTYELKCEERNKALEDIEKLKNLKKLYDVALTNNEKTLNDIITVKSNREKAEVWINFLGGIAGVYVASQIGASEPVMYATGIVVFGALTALPIASMKLYSKHLNKRIKIIVQTRKETEDTIFELNKTLNKNI